MRVDSANREVTCKVVYYGPGLSGKTTNLKQIHDRAPARAVGDLVTLDTHSERTLHFDLLPMDLGQVRGHQVRFEFYTVPGQSYYASTRRLVLDGADGVVFVADSRREAIDENIDSMNDLLDNLRHLKLPEDLPVVMQYNKQDLPSALKPEQLDPLLNSRRWPIHTAVATTGVGVIETMRAISALVLERVKQAPGTNSGSAPVIPPPTTASSTWLITCFRCQNMLETQGAKRGDLYTCGACGTALEVVDLEHGVTRTPSPSAAHVAQPGSGGVPRIDAGPAAGPAASYVPGTAGRDDSGAYGLQPAVGTDTGALGGADSGGYSTSELQPFELDGFDLVGLLDETVQGRRSRVRDRTTKARYRALVLNPTLMRQPGYAQQVETYARMASQIRHANLLPLHSLHHGREAPIFLSSEPPDHETLAHLLARRRTLAPPHAMQIGRQIVLALEEAARHGVVHGWLRPEIVLLSADSAVLVDEIGVAKHHRFLVRELSGASAATEYYLAPEHLSDDVRSDIRSDMFMLGAMLFRMLTGEGLITGYTAHEALHKAAATGCRAARSVQPNLSRDLDGFISRLVAPERKDRPQAWREVLDLCDRFGGGAKKQTFRLTQGHAAPQTARNPRPAARPQQPVTGRTTRGITASHRNPASGVRNPESGASRAERRARKDSNSFVIVLLVLVLLGAAGAALYVLNSRPARAPSAPSGGPRTAPPTAESPRTAPAPTASAGTSESPNRVLPGGPNPRVPSTLAPSTSPTPPRTDPAPAPDTRPTPAAAAVGDPRGATAGETVVRVADALRAGRFGEALALCDRLPGELGRTRAAEVREQHLMRRAEIEKRVRAAGSVEEARGILALAVSVWQMPGDEQWAEDMLTVAGTDAAIGQAVPGATATPPTGAPAPAPGPAPAPRGPNAAEANWSLEQALAKASTMAAEQALANGPKEGPEAGAIRRKFDIWKARAATLRQAIEARHPLLRITNPTDGQQWDVVGVEDGGLLVSSAAGSRTRFDWHQVPPKELGRVCAEAAAGGKDPGEHALAVVMQTIAAEPALALVALRSARGVIPEDLAQELELGVTLHRQHEQLALVQRADEAAAAGNAKALAEAIEALRRAAPATGPNPELPRLEEALKQLQAGAQAPAVLKDHLTFDAADDLGSLPQRDGDWAVQGGMLLCSSPAGMLVRRDLANAKSVALSFRNDALRGALVVNFRGVRVLCDLAKGTVLASTTEQKLNPVEFAFIPRTVHNLYIEVRGQIATVEVNNGAVQLDVKLPPRLGDALELRIDTNAAVQFDDLQLTREVKVDPVADARRIADVRSTGFEPIGQAQLVPPTIVLPAGTPRSGIAFVRRDGIASMTFEVRGTGKLEVRFGRMGEGGGQIVALDLGKKADEVVKYTVGWAGGNVTVRRGGPDGEVFVEDKLRGDPPHVMLVALAEAVLVSTPKLNRQ